MTSFPQDPLSWDQWADNVQYIDELSPAERECAKQALLYLKAVLGENFLGSIESGLKGMSHPFWNLLINLAPWTRRSRIVFAEELRSIEGSTHLDTLLRSLRDQERFPHSLLVIESTARLARAEKQQFIADWCEKHSLKPGEFQGPGVETNSVERLKSKIAEKQRQLPKDRPSVILILDNDLFFRTKDIRALISEIEEEVYKHSHIPMVIVRGTSLTGEPPEIVQLRQHRYTRKSNDLITERRLVLLNRYSLTQLSASLLSQFWRAFA